ncbi:hypothetical protein J8J14_13710 [Roseomonas sp. SSH11]|uniref:Uncharacterized protein n=1 Tax=Pararoseomonas baculiformis TaxID=2820812 RepID=A0ABS4AFQ2_9PROT|nr:hypothetical protein [Pararoseomonas baculiformis]MBP0445831.1 hypothetical protein [Pararoseomonas baculiformis]
MSPPVCRFDNIATLALLACVLQMPAPGAERGQASWAGRPHHAGNAPLPLHFAPGPQSFTGVARES